MATKAVTSGKIQKQDGKIVKAKLDLKMAQAAASKNKPKK